MKNCKKLLLQKILKEKNITIVSNIPTDALLTADQNHLSVIIRNLLQNALKFTPKGGEIAFDFEEINNQKVLSIKDNGPGIPKERLQNLFQINKNESTNKQKFKKCNTKEKSTNFYLFCSVFFIF